MSASDRACAADLMLPSMSGGIVQLGPGDSADFASVRRQFIRDSSKCASAPALSLARPPDGDLHPNPVAQRPRQVYYLNHGSKFESWF